MNGREDHLSGLLLTLGRDLKLLDGDQPHFCESLLQKSGLQKLKVGENKSRNQVPVKLMTVLTTVSLL